MQSIVSYPDRGQFGDPLWRGNTSGKLLIDLLHFTAGMLRRPVNDLLFAEQFAGGGTGRDVAAHLGCEYIGLDLYSGNDICKQPIITQLPRPADFCFGHFPYADMVIYSGHQWGDKEVEGDLSSPTMSKAEFIERMQLGLLNIREATIKGGIYAVLLGDMRRNGQFWSFQSDLIQRSPKDELISVTIKEQHNTTSSWYSSRIIPIVHEYCLVFQRKNATMYQVIMDIAKEMKSALSGTWRTLIRLVMMTLGEAKLDLIYSEIEKVAGDRLAGNPTWKATVRKNLQMHHRNVSRGVWAV